MLVIRSSTTVLCRDCLAVTIVSAFLLNHGWGLCIMQPNLRPESSESLLGLSRRRFVQAVAATGALASVGGASASSGDHSGSGSDHSGSGSDHSHDRLLTANLEGSNEVPPVKTQGNGFVVFVPENDGTLSYRIRVNKLQKVTQAHIHKGSKGKNGPIESFLLKFTKNVDGSGGGKPRTPRNNVRLSTTEPLRIVDS